MPGSRASVFGEAEDFQAALSADGVAGLLVTGRGQFRARITQVALEGLRLAAVEEQLARIAFVVVPAGIVLVAFPIDGGPSPVWGGIEIHPREIITLGPGQRLHARTAGPSHWGAIHVLGRQLAQYGRAVSGTRFAVPSAARWRSPAAAVRELRDLHRAAIRMAEARAAAFTDIEAAHGLEQQLLHALIECLSERREEEAATARRHRDILARFEDLLDAEPFLLMTEISAALGVSDRLLRECCKKHLGMGPGEYRRFRAMQQVHRALRSGNRDAASVSEVAGRHGFHSVGRFAANYRAIYGELPSATLRRASRPGMGELSLHRQRVKFS
jgi:AraC-like DNA-binding protein